MKDYASTLVDRINRAARSMAAQRQEQAEAWRAVTAAGLDTEARRRAEAQVRVASGLEEWHYGQALAFAEVLRDLTGRRITTEAILDASYCTSDDPTDHQGDTCPIHESPCGG